MKELLKKLTAEFADGDYAHAYMESHAVSRLAAQVYALRKQRGWTQKQLSNRSGVAQERISKIESADFSSITMSTLNKFSRAFDTDLTICFRPFSEGIMDITNLSAEGLRVESRETDLSTFCNMRLIERGDGNLIAYAIPDGVSVLTPQQTPQVEQLLPSEGWQDVGNVQAAEPMRAAR